MATVGVKGLNELYIKTVAQIQERDLIRLL